MNRIRVQVIGLKRQVTKMNRRSQIITGMIMLLLGIMLVGVSVAKVLPEVRETLSSNIFQRFNLSGGFEQELKPGEYVTIVEEKSGAIVDKTSRVIYVGDEIINESNMQYRVSRVKGNKAFAKKLGKATDIVWKDEWDVYAASAGVKAAQAGNKTQVAIYHTHSDESYVPTDGTESLPAKGGILKVGSALAEKLRGDGVTVIDDKTPHEPHDANAYHRSRRTAMKLLQQRPLALLDVHRDGVPDPNFYNKRLEGEPAASVRLVVGRQNPNMGTNLQFAKTVKAYMDKHKPGLIKEIFIGRGSYNQDLAPRALLLEFGTHTNTRQRAENGASIFAEALPGILNIKTSSAPGGGPAGTVNYKGTGAESNSGWKTIGWILGIVLIGGAAFLFISTGSLKGMTSKMGELKKTEFANFFGLKKNKTRNDKYKKE